MTLPQAIVVMSIVSLVAKSFLMIRRVYRNEREAADSRMRKSARRRWGITDDDLFAKDQQDHIEPDDEPDDEGEPDAPFWD